MYFFELSERFTTHPWYFALRGTTNVAFGLAALFFPATTAKLFIALFALWMIGNSLLHLAPILTGRTTRHLWRQALLSALSNLIVGTIALLSNQIALYTAAFLIGVLLLFRGILELTVLLQAPIPIFEQRFLLGGITLSIATGLFILSTPISGQYAFVKLFGAYATIIGSINIFSARRVSDEILESQ